ncbi:MAG TPA: hypothetical protein DCQ06_07130 [Myxococcales bacterium]|nr:hypothetical protein [Myxococcales bacterium]HAN31353.1 hypothetical protein [Myxococcales bacterium]
MLSKMTTLYLFTYDPVASPVKTILEYGPFMLHVHRIVDGKLICPLSTPPQLTVIEPPVNAAPAPLISAMRQHPVVGRSRALLMVDESWLSLCAGLPISDFVSRKAPPAELMARVQRLLLDNAERSNAPIRFGQLLIDIEGFEAHVNEVRLPLTPQEFALLKHLVTHAGRVHSRDSLLDCVWGRTYGGGTRTVDIHVRRLRAKLGSPVSDRLQTIRGIGYKWA